MWTLVLILAAILASGAGFYAYASALTRSREETPQEERHTCTRADPRCMRVAEFQRIARNGMVLRGTPLLLESKAPWRRDATVLRAAPTSNVVPFREVGR